MQFINQFVTVLILAVFEVAMSFNNAIVNATVLRRLNRQWQGLFLTVGLAIAVVGMRLCLPVLLVAVTARLGLGHVVDLALHHPVRYAARLDQAHPAIAAFGAAFLFTLFLDFLLDESKRVHWIGWLERPLSRWGRWPMLSAGVTLVALAAVALTWAGPDASRVAVAGLTGLGVYLAVRGLSQWLAGHEASGRGVVAGRAALGLFVYLEVLDASFSLDGVVGAFAISNDVLVIALGLGLGALGVRELTVRLVRLGTLRQFIYLEHGAQYSVGVLAVLLAASLAYDIPGAVTGILTTAVIGLALISSLVHRRQLSSN